MGIKVDYYTLVGSLVISIICLMSIGYIIESIKEKLNILSISFHLLLLLIIIRELSNGITSLTNSFVKNGK